MVVGHYFYILLLSASYNDGIIIWGLGNRRQGKDAEENGWEDMMVCLIWVYYIVYYVYLLYVILYVFVYIQDSNTYI